MGIKEIIMKRDGMNEDEALALIDSAKCAFEDAISIGDLEGAEYVMEDYFGLETDCIDELFV